MKSSYHNMAKAIPVLLLAACIDNRNDFSGASTSTEEAANTTLPAPENLSATATGSEVNLTWDAVDGATAYNVYIYDQSGYIQSDYSPTNLGATSASASTRVSVTSHLVSSLEYEVDYYFDVTAVAGDLESGKSNEVGVRPLQSLSNSTPSVQLLDISANAAEVVTLSAEVSDPDGNGVSYLWRQTSGDSVDISDSDQAESYFTAPIADAPMELGFALTVSDDYGASNSKSATVSVSDNIAPQVDAGADQSVSAGALVDLLGSASDSDGGIAEVTWQLSSGSGVILSSTSTLDTSFVAPSSSSELTLVFQLSVTDDRGANASDTVTVTVGIDQEATIDSAISTSVPENTSGIVYTVSATSSEDEVLSYDFSGADIDDFTIDFDNGTIAFSNPPDYENPADSDGDNVYQLNFEVSDSVNTLKQALSIEVTDLDEFNVVAPGDDDAAANEIAENSDTGTLVGLTASASDADGTNNTISYSFAGSSLTSPDGLFDIDASTGVVSYNGSGSLDYETGATSYSLDIYAHSSDGSSASASFSVNIIDVNEAPVFASTSDSANALENSTDVFYSASATDEDAGASVSYFLASSGADNYLFNLDNTSGELQFKAAPDYETFLDSNSDGIYQVIISASDGSLSSENDLELAVSVSNVNEAPTITSATSASTPENTESTTTIYAASATDPENDTLTYALSGIDADDFNINSSSGTISFANTPNYESPTDANTDNVYQVTLETSDGNGNSASQELIITVTNVNEIPLITSSANASVPENTTTTIYTASATDPEDDTLTYALSGTDTDDFIIEPSSGAISFVDTPNYEIPTDDNSNNVYQVTLEVSDDNDNNTSLVLTIKVTNVNEAPTFTSATSASVPENTTTTIYTASATDPENDTLTYSLSGTDKDEFIIDSSSGAISFANTPDHETPTDANNDNDYQIILEVSDDNGNSASQELTITVTDGNEIPTITSATSASILENTSGTIYTASATDPENDTLTYALSSTDKDDFTIDSSSGTISFTINPDYENPADADTDNVYQVTLEVSDGSNTVTQALTFTVTDSNEFSVSTPTDADGNPNQISEDAVAGTAVGITASASDADGTNNTVSYGFTNDNLITTAESLFSVASDTGIVTLTHSNVLDYESETSYKLVIEATSSDGSSATSTFTIDLTDVNEHHVSFSVLSPDADSSPDQISEDAVAGTAVGITASASDYDGTNNTISYSFTNDSQTSADNLFSIASDTGIVTLANSNSLDYENATSHDIAVKATSSDGSSTTRTFTIDVTDVNDNTPIITPSQSFSVDEASANDTSLGTVAFSDADSDAVNTFTWSITAGNTNNAFAIDPSTGEITVATSSQLDTETTPSYTLTFTVSDGANISSAETVTISINDLNDNAPVITASQSFSVDENSANDTSVGTVALSDADSAAVNTFTWSITAGNTNDAFAINASTGEITVNTSSELDYESGATSYTLSLTVSDGANTSSAETVTININDLNDNAPIITASQSFSIDENSADDTSVGTVAATDADATATTYQNWTIVGGNTNNAFAIDSDTGELTVNTSSELDTETTPSYSLSITVSDGVNTANAETVTISVNDLNDNTPIITPSQSFDIDEASANGTSLGTVAATDADATATTYQNWSITAGNTNNAFAIDPSTGELTVNTSSELDYESGTILYTLALTVSDGATTSAAEDITINILDVSEHDAAPSAAYLGLPDNYINITFTPESGVSYQLHRSFVEGCTSSSCDAEGYQLFASPNSGGTADTMTFSQTHYYSLVGDNSTTFTTSINDSDGAKLAALVAAQSLSTEYDLANDWVNISATDSNNVTYTLYMAGEPFAAGGCEDSELDNIGSLCADGSSLSDGSMHSATEVINWSARRYYRLDISDGYQVVHSLESNASVIDPVVLNASNASLTIDITWSALNSAKLAEYTVYLSEDSAATTASAATWSSLSNSQIISGNSSELYSLVPILSQYYVAITATNTESETTPLSKVYLANNIVTGDPDPSTWHEIIADTDDSPAHWEGRSTHASVVYQDKMWLIGGRTASEAHIAEVWSSTDGYNWTEVNPSAAFGARKEFVSMVHDGKMWVLGGEIEGYVLANDVWYSSDGANWHEATEAASWHARDYFGGVSFASGATGSDEMWVLGHYTGDPRGIPGVEDHHYSTDGSTWSSVSVSGLPPSSFFPAITFNNAILIVGGYFYTNSAWSNSNSIYSSADGVNWTELSVSGSIWDARRIHTTLVYDDKLWVLAGDSGYNRDDYWYSSDGTQWHEATASGSKWEARSVHTSVNYAGRMWMLGGYGSTGDKQLNDVWASGLEITSFSFNPVTTN